MIRRVSPFFAQLRTMFLAVVSLSLIGVSVATDYIFRHEIKRKARNELEAQGLQPNINGIIKAVREGKLGLFEQYDTAGISFGGVDRNGLTPLYVAVENKDKEAVEQLFLRQDQIKGTVNTTNVVTGLTPLQLALNDSDFLLANRLIDHLGANLDIEKEPGLPYLLDAMMRDDDAMRDYLLSKGVDVNEKGLQKHPPFALAADDDDLELMSRLISQGARINIKGVSGKPLLIESALQNEYEEMDFLLENGSDVDVTHDGQNPLMMALATQDGRMMSLLLKYGPEVDRVGPSGKHLIFEAIESNDHDWFLTLLDSGVPIEAKSSKGDTLFMDAVKREDYRMIDFLIEKKADVNVTDKNGQTPLEWAVASGNTALVRTLVENGAEIDHVAMFSTAYRRRDNPTMNLLLNAGISPETELKGTGKRIMDAAVEDGAPETVRTLLDAGADIGKNLWAALLTKQDDLVSVILDNGGDPKQTGPNGEEPVEYVLNTQRVGLLAPLLDAGADPNPMFDGKETWVSRAVRTGNRETAHALITAGASLGDGFALDGHSLLGWSIAHEMEDVAIALVEAGVDVNVIEPSPARSEFIEAFDESTTFRKALKYDSKIRPLMMVAVKRNHNIAQAMVKAGARNEFSRRYLYPVAIAAWYADVRMMQIFYGRNPDNQPRKIVIDLSSQRVSLYENGKSTYSSTCSTGKSGYRTPTGTYAITQKHKDHISTLYHSPMPYFMRLSCRDFGLHQGHCPGYPASHGCIRLPWSTAKHLFYKCSLGDMVVIQQ